MANVVGATTNLIGAVGGAASSFSGGLASGLSGGFGSPLGTSLPAPNILGNYASYTYSIGLSAMTLSDYNFPDQSYKSGKVLPLICKSAGADPTNRVATGFGKFDFFINNLTFEAVMGYQSAKATNVSTIQFDVYEPYSIGLFMLALQRAADNAGFTNWRDAPFLLSIEFRGNKENGQIAKVPFSTRHIPIKITTVDIKANEQGCRYLINSFGSQGTPQTTEFAKLRTDTVIKGKTVQEVLQTGMQSLQAVINAQLQEYVTKGDVKIADQIVILFPKEEDMPSSKVQASASASARKGNTATLNPQLKSTASDIYKQIGVNISTLEQSATTVNEIGAAAMGFGQERRADAPSGNEQDTWDPVMQSWLRGKLVPNAAEGSFKFAQNSDIPTAINQILLTSSYAETALAENAVDGNGMRTWWRIETQMFYVDSPENITKTGKLPKIAVYKIVPFKVHPGKVAGPGKNIKGLAQINGQVVKRYDYIFTGKNTEVISFDINYSVGFANALAADGYRNSTDIARAKKTANADGGKPNTLDPGSEGEAPNKVAGSQFAGSQTNTGTGTAFDGRGGGGQETEVQRAARSFHDAITNPVDMINIDLEILGDPYWIVNSGMGNYTSKSVQGVKDLNKDGSVNWQNSEVDIIVNFRTPIDINQVTGMYDFKGPNHQDMTKDPKGGPAVGFTGLYNINLVTNYFRDGSFRQRLKGFRRGNQENKKISPPKDSLNAQTPAEKK
jgi:hypothetical protein